MSDLVIGYSPLSDEIIAGRGKDGCVTGKKCVVTAEAVEAVIHYVSDDLTKRYCRDVRFGDIGIRITVEPIEQVAAATEAPHADR